MKPSNPGAIVQHGDGSLSVVFDLEVTGLASIKKAAYKLASDCSAVLATGDPGKIEVRLSFPESTAVSDREQIARALCNEVIDQDLRELIAAETAATRNLILAQAFSKTSLIKEDGLVSIVVEI